MTMSLKLTPLQIETLRMLVADMTDKEIADAQRRSHRTVEKRIQTLRMKLRVRSRVGLAVAAVRLELV